MLVRWSQNCAHTMTGMLPFRVLYLAQYSMGSGLSNHAVELLSIFGKGAHRNRRRRLRTNVLVSDYMRPGTASLDLFMEDGIEEGDMSTLV